jgi:hypothetical protein
MSEYDRTSNNNLVSTESAALDDITQLLRNVINRVAADGSKDINLLQFIQGLAANTAIPKPDRREIYHGNAIVTREQLIRGTPGMAIVISDLFVSLNGICNISFLDDDGNYVHPTMYGPNAGQGFTAHFTHGLWLPFGKGLAHSSTAAVAYSIGVNYTLVERAPE